MSKIAVFKKLIFLKMLLIQFSTFINLLIFKNFSSLQGNSILLTTF